ncbi:putative Mg2+ transporter-C (MgtC) family protein [Actinacidiphila yanglinensis]|uniref:Putative Mg2+ transporter-C (MgtC) family protein n=1 Tax=Actinacidiphila yanglinensis TaxID=310779 RepID=A0A1H5Z048_9ACTN|nr:MgtC/SapB family protein [Actinacidiphila yanglinensis]SEG28816.1 putative Mg2+ transporter-C (MgtC) family protein [Actinacidiphila yanglinensis]
MYLASWGEATGQGWQQISELGLAFLLSAAIGLEREVRQKSAGMRTHTLVGLGSALIMLVSKYGFGDVLGGHTVLDPSRVAAQIVSGIGFIGGGLIFVRQDVVRGLTTAAVVWMTAAIGMAAGAGLPVLALVVAGAHFLIVLGFAPLAARIPGSTRSPAWLRLDYEDGRGVLRAALVSCTDMGYNVVDLSAEHDHDPEHRGEVTVNLTVQGPRPVVELATVLAEIEGVHRVSTTQDDVIE